MRRIALGIAAATLILSTSVAGAQQIKEPAAIAKFVGPFKTYTGQPLIELLAQYGMRIEWIDTTPIDKMIAAVRRPGDQNGDLVTTLSLTGKPKKMPCNLDRWMRQGYAGGHAEDMAEIMYRNGRFLINAPDLNPVLYWAATGKCSTQYAL
ncbi:hypothetical protein CSQ90_26685 [Janthinobacterium sp. BJB303]|nr:hypothetical protein CSQ90_26685 [Janthinobacterium sp. BJB303]